MRLKDLIEGTVDHHASLTHPDLQEVTICWRGSFGCLTAWAGEGDENDQQIPLCRIEYLGEDEDWGFAIYDPATETYTPAILRTGEPTGHPMFVRMYCRIHDGGGGDPVLALRWSSCRLRGDRRRAAARRPGVVG